MTNGRNQSPNSIADEGCARPRGGKGARTEHVGGNHSIVTRPPRHWITSSVTFVAMALVSFVLIAGLATKNSNAREQIASTAPMSPIDPVALYGDQLEFAVTRNGDPVGEHIVKFRKDGNDVLVESTFTVDIRFLVFTAYTYRYTSQARWRNGRLVDLDAKTDDNGDVLIVEVRTQPDGALRVSGDSGTTIVTETLFPTNHWNPGVLGADRVINTINGEIADVAIKQQTPAMIEMPHGTIEATRHDYLGDIETSVWYDNHGRWVRMRFEAKDGSIFDYACQVCGGPDSKNSSKVVKNQQSLD